ncbi:MAG TPA: EscU/YscU/HrcU family type III secretion system export apparatus switch protein [Syntrophales bacterium]|nr:EscU/YscU/HrcU family type III secretion system export apparatus switch protein [Syntrophales bacterium]HOM06886.1 EscU/YscU/HrcU family type III secretion system export apparatus switch protein [Syntrophales bacterium]HON99403.1 EscU/YscU/HrcU family type III secretion system export apparatus switch protein [Syntrophales bacterium]HPC00560.1 EscU/YscU/HrcU family type III secretion system export apparatus switch protein [Syntrophales bacterium]HPQ06427.1 EscU/YscU/HrcU family type III secre
MPETGKREKRPPLAAALRYDPGKDRAPKVTAKGRGFIAEKIIALAKKHDIPIKEDPHLVQILYRLDLDEEIPPKVYRAVAEILAFVYRLNEKRRPHSSTD